MSARRINFAFGVHNHQPVGNFDHILDDAYDKAYLPFMECLQRHPKIKVAMHYTGPLWDYYLENKPQWIEMLRNLVKEGRMEMLSGAYYEPILINISDRDKVGQIKKLNRVVRRESGYKPTGMWCAERIWEPQLAKPISLSGIQYTILDDYHFRSNGLSEEDIFGYYVTEEQGFPLVVIPISYTLRYTIPHGKPEDAIEYLRKSASEEGDRLAVFADDGEKFGVWPKSYEAVWGEKWLDRFFDLVEKNSDWINMVTPSEYMAKYPPKGRVYLPTASYFEMSVWSLPLESRKKIEKLIDGYHKDGTWDENRNFLKGGFWRNFLVKFPESNRIQKKALYVSEKVQEMVTGDREDALNELYMAQCNCAYWHGVFGGIYLPHLRHGIQEHLIEAETLADNEKHKDMPFKEILKIDINRDMLDEVIVNTLNLNLGFAPHNGGSLYELAYKPEAINFCDTLNRQPEAYHEGMMEIRGIDEVIDDSNRDKYLQYDRYERNSFLDHFLSEDVDMETFRDQKYEELGDFIGKPYDVFTSGKDDKAILTLSRKASVKSGDENYNVEVEKTFFVSEGGKSIQVQYWVINNSDETLKTKFGCELDLTTLSKDMSTNFLYVEKESEEEEKPAIEKICMEASGELKETGKVSLQDGHRYVKIHIDSGEETSGIWHFPLYTVSMSEDGLERICQSVVIMPVWNLELDPGDSWENNMEIVLEDMIIDEEEQDVDDELVEAAE